MIEKIIHILRQAADGKKLETSSGSPVNNEQLLCEIGSRLFGLREADDPKPKIAAGHNPARMTEEQVGVMYGWRLLERAEIYDKGMRTTDIQAWGYLCDEGWSTEPCEGNEPRFTYRTKKPPGYYLHKTKKDLGPEDFPPGVVCHHSTWPPWAWAYCWPTASGIVMTTQPANPDKELLFVDWADLQRGWSRSLDSGKTWLPC